MVKILCTGDVHLRDTPPKMCRESYADDLFDLIVKIAGICYMRDVDVMVLSGDLFDNKTPRNNSYKLLQRTVEVFQQFRIPIFVLPANHDMQHDSFESVFETQPLGVLYRSRVVQLLSGWADDPQWKGTSYSYLNPQKFALPVYGVPWLREYDIEDEAAREAAVDEALAGLQERQYEEAVLLSCHSPLFPPGLESPWQNYSVTKFAKQIRNVYKGLVTVHYSHIHDYHGIYEVNGIKFCNLGALSRGSLTESNLHRKLSLLEFDSSTNEVKEIPIDHKPAEEVFRLEKAEEIKKDKMNTSEFVSMINESRIELITVDGVIDKVREVEVDRRVHKIVQELLEKVNK